AAEARTQCETIAGDGDPPSPDTSVNSTGGRAGRRRNGIDLACHLAAEQPVWLIEALHRGSALPQSRSDPAQQYMSGGITEDIITVLSSYRELLVIARNSAFRCRDQPHDMKHVAQELGVG